MKNLIKKTYKDEAHVIDGKLILSFPNAVNPIVWQMDLVGAKASALQVDSHDTHFDLTLKTAKNETSTVASFATRDQAVQALTAVSRALENASGKIQAGHTPSASGKTCSGILPKLLKALKIFVGLVIIYAIFTAFLYFFSLSGSNVETAPVSQTPTSESGVPMSADDFLKGQ